MTELQNIGLVYESSVLLVENVEKRIQYVLDKYGKRMAQVIKVPQWFKLRCPNHHTPEDFVRVRVNLLAENADPSGRYLEWIVRTVLAECAMTGGYFDDTLRPEDSYKIKENLEVFDRLKHKMPVEDRNINSHNFGSLADLVEELTAVDRELSRKALEKKVKAEESIKLVDDLNGWHVVVPKTKLAARYYGAHTRWCTAAKMDEDNAFDTYNDKAPLFIFIKGETKYQWHGVSIQDVPSQNGTPRFKVNVHLMDEKNEPARYASIPVAIWKAVTDLRETTSDARIKTALELMYQQWQQNKYDSNADDEDQGPYDATDGRNQHPRNPWDD